VCYIFNALFAFKILLLEFKEEFVLISNMDTKEKTKGEKGEEIHEEV